VKISLKGGGIIFTLAQASPLQDPKFTLKLTRVEVVELSEIFSDCIVKDITNRLAFVDGTKTRIAIIVIDSHQSDNLKADNLL
jgi:hypothetical protein